jgi:hypothetical protein
VIVSHEHRFIFVKTRKTAGTSIEVALSPVAGDDAIVTPIEPPEPGHRPRGWQGLFNPLPEIRDRARGHEPSLQRRPLSATASDLRRRRPYRNHMPASLIRARLGRDRWERYFTFCFERNPWDKVISWYFWQHADVSARPPFEQWALAAPLPTDWDRYTLDGSIAVDFVGRFEELETDLQKALSRVGLADVPPLPRAKGQQRDGRVETPITDAVDARIRDVFRREIEAFGYARPAGLT